MGNSTRTSWVSYRDLEAATGASATTLRRFVERFPMFLACRMVDRRQMFPATAVEVVRRIQGLYASGKTTKEILGILAVEMAATIEIRPEGEVNALPRSVEGQNGAVIGQNELVGALEPLVGRFVGALEQMAKNQAETLELLRQLVQGGGKPAERKTMAREEIVARIQALAAEGLGERAIQTRLVSEGVPTVSGRGSWSSSTIRRFMKLKGQEGQNHGR